MVVPAVNLLRGQEVDKKGINRCKEGRKNWEREFSVTANRV